MEVTKAKTTTMDAKEILEAHSMAFEAAKTIQYSCKAYLMAEEIDTLFDQLYRIKKSAEMILADVNSGITVNIK